jgi:cell wall-associated NlpC family hydrolase
VRAPRRHPGAGTRAAGVRAALRIGGVAVVAALALGFSPSVAEATPQGPSDTEIAAAQAAADAVADRIRDLSGQMAAAQDAVDAARATAVIKLDDYQSTQSAYLVAQQQADAAAAAAAKATADLGVAQAQVIDFARRSYMEGSTYSGAAALLTAADPAELIERAALLEAAGGHRSDVLDRVVALQVQAAGAEAAARTGLETAAGLQEQAAAALTVAKDAEVSARAQAAALDAQEAQLQSELTAAQGELQGLIGERAAADRAAQAAAQVARPVVTPPPAGIAPAPAGNGAQAGAGDTSSAQRAVDAAMAYRGTPYAWGGGGTRGPGPGQAPDEGVVGFDCSGLTQYAYARAGIAIPRNSRAQYTSLPKVSSKDLRPGDLVFWATDVSDPDTIHHVAIWLGGAMMLEAPQSGSVVKVSDMRWKGYIGAVRPSA